MKYTTRCIMLLISIMILLGLLLSQDVNLLLFVGVPIWLGWVIGELLLIDQQPGWQYRLRKYK